MNRYLNILVFLFLLPTCGAAHGDKFPLSFSGIVSEPAGGHPVEGAVISVEKNGQVIQSTRTDAKGKFSLKIEAPLNRRDQLKLKVQKHGFKSQMHLPVNCQNENLKIGLERKQPMPIIKHFGTAGQLYAI